MALFAYRAHDLAGSLLTGEIAAESLLAALELLRGRGLFVAGLEERSQPRPSLAHGLRRVFGRSHLGAREPLFCRQLSVLLSSGLTLHEALASLAGEGRGEYQIFLRGLQEAIAAGHSLAEAMQSSGAFRQLAVELARVGEETGELAAMLGKLADWLEQEQAGREKLKTALAYPLFLVVETVVVTAFLVFAVLPTFASLFRSFQADLPLPTRALLAGSAFLAGHWPELLLGAASLALLGLVIYQQPSVRRALDRFRLRGPFFGRLARVTAWAQTLHALAMLSACGISRDRALSLARGVPGNLYLYEVLGRLAAGTLQGFTLSAQLAREPSFPPFLLEFLKAGEATGREAELLGRAADYAHLRAGHLAARMQVLAEPLAYLVIFALVGGTVAAVALPWLEMMTLFV